MSNKLRIAFAGGGSGGHFYPLISVAEQLSQWATRNGFEPDFRYFGDPEGYRFALEEAGIKISRIASSKLRRQFSILNFFDFFKFIFGFIQSLWKLYWFMPAVVFSKGGPGALQVVFAGQFYLIPLALHESDSVPGLTNRLSGRRARVIDLAFASAAKYFSKGRAKINIVGNPVRQEVLKVTPPDQAKAAFGFKADKPLILIFGGSQGSNRLNEFILANLEQFLLKYQMLHAVGREKFPEYKSQYDFISKNFSPLLKDNYKFVDFLDKNQGKAMDAADLIVSRGGAGAIFEIAAKAKPSIIIPFPEAASDHQKFNAYEYAETGAAVVIEQGNFLPSIFLTQVEKILSNPETVKRMSGAAKDFSQPEAAKKIATDILELWQG